MMAHALLDTAEELLAGDRGILAMDERIATCNRRFAAAGIDPDAESRRAYRKRALGFSFGRAIQQPALEIWHGESANVTAAQHALRHRARCDQMARRGEYSAETEETAA